MVMFSSRKGENSDVLELFRAELEVHDSKLPALTNQAMILLAIKLWDD